MAINTTSALLRKCTLASLVSKRPSLDSQEIADSVDIDLELGNALSDLPVAQERQPDEYLRDLCSPFQGAVRRDDEMLPMVSWLKSYGSA